MDRPRIKADRARPTMWAVAFLTAAAMTGCGSAPVRSGGSSTPSEAEAEPNNTFGQAQKAVYDDSRAARLSGTIDGVNDLDVFDLGALSPGDRLIVDLDAVTEGLDASAVVFDGNLSIFVDNDDESLAQGKLDPYIDEVARHASDRYYVVVGRSAFGGFSPFSGEYRATVRVLPGNAVPDPKPQILFLNFDGGEVEPDNLLVKEVTAFEAARIDPSYSGQDEIIRDSIVATVIENFEPFDVEIIADAADLPDHNAYSTVMLGSRNVRAYGISESVDHYNFNQRDVAIVFTESFDPAQFTQTPTAQELGVAIGNIAAHEAGHLLGLNHVDDETALMDAVSPADTFLADQEFRIGPLSGDILPIGYQDAPLLLSETVGLLEGYGLPLPAKIRVDAGPRLKKPQSAYWCGTCNPGLAGGKEPSGE